MSNSDHTSDDQGPHDGGIGGGKLTGPNGEKRVQPTGTREMRRRRMLSTARLKEARARVALADATMQSGIRGDIAVSLEILHDLVDEATEDKLQVILNDEGVDAKLKRRVVAAKKRQAAFASKEILRHHREMAKIEAARSKSEDEAGAQHQHVHLHLERPRAPTDPVELDALMKQIQARLPQRGKPHETNGHGGEHG